MQTEEGLFRQQKFQSRFCLLSATSTTGKKCLPYRSITNLFDGTFRRIDTDFNDPNFDEIPKIINLGLHSANDEVRITTRFCLGSAATVSNQEVFAKNLRGSMEMGVPLQGFSRHDQNGTEQRKVIGKYYREELLPYMESLYNLGVGVMKYYFSSPYMVEIEAIASLKQDLLLAIGSVIVISFILYFKTDSLFTTVFAIFCMFLTFIVTEYIYFTVFQVDFLSIYHVLSLFILLQIGLDGIFLFYESWEHIKQEQRGKHTSVLYVVFSTFKGAGGDLVFTSTSTFLAFATSLSPFVVINLFEYFCAILISINYFAVIFFFPLCVLMYEWHVFKLNRACSNCYDLCCGPDDFSDSSDEEDAKKDDEDEIGFVEKLADFLTYDFHWVISNNFVKVFLSLLFSGLTYLLLTKALEIEIRASRVSSEKARKKNKNHDD